ncbi:uncharacterized protein IL334_007180 [Kwoniella shivajii]|uniref:Pre-mRNA-splicing factor 38B n=1 Tax=Kwoniella shivajii TaxID=564305 RepID=A0ABZ1D8R2_9TREE|nr:hypothetical protein IL334_007180 [Kwoniella shivajii]
MSLNSVVNNLVRAAAGISTSISDSDLDAHVAKLLAEEAKARELKWSELGLTGLLGSSLDRNGSPDTNLPKTNKRFLASVIRTVDGHNSALLKSQAQAAQDARQDRRGGGESSSSSTRGGRGVGNRLFGGALKDMGRNSGLKGKERERDSGNERSSRRHHDDTDDRHRHTSRRERRGDRYDDERSDRYRSERDGDRDSDMHRDRTIRHRNDENGHSARRLRHDYPDEEEYTNYAEQSHINNNQRRSISPIIQDRKAHPPQHRSNPPSPPRSPSPAPAPISKMDKYFSQTYDPRLDLPAVPKEGMIQDVGWDNMLAILKEKGKKRRNQSPTLSDSIPAPPPGVLPSKRAYSPDTLSRKLEKKDRRIRKEERRKRRGSDSDSSENERERKKEKKRKERQKDKERERQDELKYSGLKKEGGSNKATSGILDGYNYSKQGSTREWDVGK